MWSSLSRSYLRFVLRRLVWILYPEEKNPADSFRVLGYYIFPLKPEPMEASKKLKASTIGAKRTHGAGSASSSSLGAPPPERGLSSMR